MLKNSSLLSSTIIAVALLAIGGFASANAVSSSTATVKFCVNKKTFAVSQRTNCKSSEKTVTVNQLGPAGPASLPKVYRGNPRDAERAVGITVPNDTYQPITIWKLPSSGKYLVTQNFVVHAFPNIASTHITVECFIGDLNGYYSGTSIIAAPNPQVPVGVTTFNTGYGSITYATNGESQYLPFCRNLSNDSNVHVATWAAAVVPIGDVADLPANHG